jgi:CheY-like chemotaxis protein
MSHVLITDDNVVNRRLLVAFLRKQNIKYQEAENGLDALQKYQEGSVRFDAILMGKTTIYTPSSILCNIIELG